MTKTGVILSGIFTSREDAMPKQTTPETRRFGQRLTELRKAAGYTQQELADEVGVSRRMIAYYEGQSAHPPTTLLPTIARALNVSTDELLGVSSAKTVSRRRDTRLQRRLQQIAQLPPEERRQLLQLVDTYIERGQLKKRLHNAA